MVSVNATTIMVLGGTSATYKSTWYYDIPSYKWTDGPPLRWGRRAHTCSIINGSSGSGSGSGPLLVLVLGGFGIDDDSRTIEVLDIQSNKWLPGPSFQSFHDGHSLTSWDQKHVYVVLDSGEIHDVVCAGTDCTLTKMPQELTDVSNALTPMLIPDSLTKCTFQK